MPNHSLPGALLARVRRTAAASAIAAVLATALLAGASEAYRPFDLTDADVVKRHYFEFELGPAELVGVGAEHSLRAPNFTINYGLATGREIALEGNNHVALEPESDEPHAQLEDVAIAMKQIMRRGSLQDESGPSIAIENEITFPARGEEHLGTAASLIVSSASKRGSTHFNVEGERLPEGRNAGSVGMIFEASDRYGVAPAVELSLAAVDGALPEHSAVFGLIYVPREGLEYDVALRFAGSGTEKSFEIRAGLTCQISARKVLEEAAEAMTPPHPRRRRH